MNNAVFVFGRLESILTADLSDTDIFVNVKLGVIDDYKNDSITFPNADIPELSDSGHIPIVQSEGSPA